MGTSATTPAMAFELIKEAEKGRRKITRRQQLELVREGRVFKDGGLVTKESARYCHSLGLRRRLATLTTRIVSRWT